MSPTLHSSSDSSGVLSTSPPVWQPVLLAALAGGMGWGIRGQYGHETGAMIAGLLVSLVLVFLMYPQAALLPAARAVAFGTIAIGIGGSMTYGQTIGLTQIAPLIALIPMVAVAGGRWWPFLLALPITAVPILGKTIRSLVYESHAVGLVSGWLGYGALPLTLTTAVAIWFARQLGRNLCGREYARRALLLSTWLYFGLNYAFFRFPWPWEKWTSRTPNAMAFMVCALGLTLACLILERPGQRKLEPTARGPLAAAR